MRHLLAQLPLLFVLAPAPVLAERLQVDLGPDHHGWSLELITGAEGRRQTLHRIRVRDATGQLRQLLRHRCDGGSPTEVLHLEDYDFDGHLDLGVVREWGAKWGIYRVWRFDPHRSRFVESPFTRALGSLPNLEVDRARRELVSSSVGPSDPWRRRYRVERGRLQPVCAD